MSEHDELQQILGDSAGRIDSRNARADQCEPSQPTSPAVTESAKVNYAQWEIEPNDMFLATGGTRATLPPGVYRLLEDQRGIHFARANVLTDKLIDLHDSAANEILDGIRTFWKSKAHFDELGILYKRGCLLWGPPGSGKTATVQRLMKELVDDGGFVILCDSPRLAVHALAQVRRIEPDRRLIVVEEDIEEIMNHHGEHQLLALLDGENQIANVVHIATTNYPDQLGARIINRPSRFDEVKKIGMPNEWARAAYFKAILGTEKLADYGGEERWVMDTEGMSIAHLRELVVAVYCLGRGYEETLDRLKKMGIKPKSHEDGFSNGRS